MIMFADILCSKAYFPTFFLNICGSAAVSRGVARGLRSAAPGALLRPRGPRHHILLPGLQGQGRGHRGSVQPGNLG